MTQSPPCRGKLLDPLGSSRISLHSRLRRSCLRPFTTRPVAAAMAAASVAHRLLPLSCARVQGSGAARRQRRLCWRSSLRPQHFRTCTRRRLPWGGEAARPLRRCRASSWQARRHCRRQRTSGATLAGSRPLHRSRSGPPTSSSSSSSSSSGLALLRRQRALSRSSLPDGQATLEQALPLRRPSRYGRAPLLPLRHCRGRRRRPLPLAPGPPRLAVPQSTSRCCTCRSTRRSITTSPSSSPCNSSPSSSLCAPPARACEGADLPGRLRGGGRHWMQRTEAPLLGAAMGPRKKPQRPTGWRVEGPRTTARLPGTANRRLSATTS